MKYIELKYDLIRSKMVLDERHSVYTNGKEFAYGHVMGHVVVTHRKTRG